MQGAFAELVSGAGAGGAGAVFSVLQIAGAGKGAGVLRGAAARAEQVRAPRQPKPAPPSRRRRGALMGPPRGLDGPASGQVRRLGYVVLAGEVDQYAAQLPQVRGSVHVHVDNGRRGSRVVNASALATAAGAAA